MLVTPNLPRTLLAFDFGTRHIGVAVGQTITHTATPLDSVSAKDGIPNWAQLEKLVNEWQPDAFIVGIPFNMDGSESDMSMRARKFGNRLHGRFNKPWHEMDERLSSFEAKQWMAEHDKKAHAQRALVDSKAAQLILESWFKQQASR